MPSGAGCPSRPSRSFSLRHIIATPARSLLPRRRLEAESGAAGRAPRPTTRRGPARAPARGRLPGSATATAPADSSSGALWAARARAARRGRRRFHGWQRDAGATGAAAATVVAGPPATPQRAARRRAPAPGCLGRARGSPPPRAISQVATALRPPATAPRQAETRAARATVELPLTPPPPRPRPRPPRRRPTPRPGPRRPLLFARCPPMREAAPPAGSSACGTARDRPGTHGRARAASFQTRAGCNPCKRRGRMAGSADRRGPVWKSHRAGDVDEKRPKLFSTQPSTSMHKGHEAPCRSSRTRLSRGGDGAAAEICGQPASMWSAMATRGIF